jgi:hypothetical protein
MEIGGFVSSPLLLSAIGMAWYSYCFIALLPGICDLSPSL